MSKEPENKPKNWADDFSSEDDGDDEDDEYEDEPEQDGEQSNESQEVVGNSRNNNRSSVDPPRAFVGSIHFGASEEEICSFFESRNCKIANIVLHQHADGKPKGSVVIEFADEESLNICLDLNGEKLRGMSIKTKLVEQHHGNKQQQQHAGHRTSRYDNVAPNDYYANRPPAGPRHEFAPNAPYRGGGSRHDVQNDPQRPRQVNAHNEPYKGGGSRQNYGHNESYRGVDSRQDYGPNEQYRGVGSRAGYGPNEPYRGDGSRYDDVPNEPYRPRRVNVYNEPYSRGVGSRQDYEPYRGSGSRQEYTQSGPYRGAGSRQDYGPNEPPYRGGGSQDYGPNEPFRAGASRQDYGPNGSYRGSSSRQDYVQDEPYRGAGSRKDYGPNEPPYREGPRHDSEPYRQDNEQYRGGRQDTEQYRGGRQNPEQYRRGGGGQYRHDNYGPNEGYAGGRHPGGGSARYDGNARPYPDKNGPGFDSHDRDSGKGGRVNRRQPSEEVPNKPLPEVHPEATAVAGTRPQLNIQPRSIPADGSRQTAANPDIFGGGKAHDDKVYQVIPFGLLELKEMSMIILPLCLCMNVLE